MAFCGHHLGGFKLSFWGHHRPEQIVATLSRSQLGFQLGDPLLSCGQLSTIFRRRSWLSPGVDQMLVPPVADRRCRHLQALSDLGHRYVGIQSG